MSDFISIIYGNKIDETLMMSGTDMISFYADAHYFTLHSAADLA
jgi:hypothetical protein